MRSGNDAILQNGNCRCRPVAGARERDKLRGAIAQLDRKLATPQFLSRAPAEVMAEQRARRAAADDLLRKFDSAAARLDAL